MEDRLVCDLCNPKENVVKIDVVLAAGRDLYPTYILWAYVFDPCSLAALKMENYKFRQVNSSGRVHGYSTE